ncbi:SPOR domain-containing protein [Segatella copri]|uniref:SPOR domain-containing protein n=1 Tax=Segatella TaxID=2974251 RepID=UPI001C487F69|nr:SPOR domain-containing protein [Segatella copri]MBW0020922.1 SPOR domain-containing protein [Segatella copri]MBW0036789.1 SPOR domain-containing protein [Segatella copri]
MKKITVLSMGMCAVLALASCGTSKESAYKKAYEKAQQQEQQAAQAPVAQEPVVAPLETQAPSDEQTEVDNATVRSEDVSLISGSGLSSYSVVVGSFSLKANAEGLASTLKSAGYDAQIALNKERNMYRVVASSFADKAAAVKSRNQLRAGKYPDAWLLLKK